MRNGAGTVVITSLRMQSDPVYIRILYMYVYDILHGTRNYTAYDVILLRYSLLQSLYRLCDANVRI